MNGLFFFQEMTEIVRAIYDMMGKYTYPALKGDVPQQHVDAFFQVNLCYTALTHQKSVILLKVTGDFKSTVFTQHGGETN